MAELHAREPLIFELSKPGRRAGTQFPPRVAGSAEVPAHLRLADDSGPAKQQDAQLVESA